MSKLADQFPAGAIDWLRNGERGVSSEAIFQHMTGVPVGAWSLWPPADTSDMRRCRLLLAAVPEFRERLHEMAELPRWKTLVDRWDEICALMDDGKTNAACRAITECIYPKAAP